MHQKWIGIHDHSDSAVRWLDAGVSYTWLRAFEQAQGVETVAYLREHHYRRDLEIPVRGVRYCFRNTEFPDWAEAIISERPSLILYNLCYYKAGAPIIRRLREALPGTLHVIRIHHQVTYLAAHEGFAESVLACDVAIAPTPGQIPAVRDLGFRGPVHALPFGIDAEVMARTARHFRERDFDLVCACNSHPARNRSVVEAVLEVLKSRGRRVCNFQDMTRPELAAGLGRAKTFWLSSLTEASGSRIMPEAIDAGCYPIAFEECFTAEELLQTMGVGSVIRSGIAYDYRTKTTAVPDSAVADLADKLDAIIAQRDAVPDWTPAPLARAYHEHHEVADLTALLREVGAQPRP